MVAIGEVKVKVVPEIEHLGDELDKRIREVVRDEMDRQAAKARAER